MADGCALVVALIAGLDAARGYLFEVPELQRRLGVVAAHADGPAGPPLALLAAQRGLLAARTEGGLMALWSSDGPGGGLVRRLAPAAVDPPDRARVS